MNRRNFVLTSLAAAGAASALALPRAIAGPRSTRRRLGDEAIPVAFVISPGANVIDLAGAWEVFQDVMLGDPDDHATHQPGFDLYTVSDSREPLEATGGLGLLPDYTLEDAPPPAIVSVGAQRGSEGITAWLAEQAGRADVVMSVCTGAFQLGRAGLLDGKRATTHHLYWDALAERFPRAEVVRGSRFVVDGRVMTAGGLTSGIDLALHVVERYYGREQARQTADYMEYEGRRWMESGS